MTKTRKIILNTAVFLIVLVFVGYIAWSVNEEELTYAESREEAPFASPYRQVASFELPREVNRFDLHNGKLVVSAGQSVYIYDMNGMLLTSFPVRQNVRDITAKEGSIYLLYPSSIEVYTADGQLSREWEACSELSDYCSFALAGEFLFVTDAENKNICVYTQEGGFVRFIRSPDHFIIPGYAFDIESRNDTVYCVNSGRHRIEAYTPDGTFIASFGAQGGEPGRFAGCCNPVYISFTPEGMLLTSEKGNPRIGSFHRDGRFQEILLDSRLLGGGNKAYEVRVCGDRLFVAGKNKITIYRYDKKRPEVKAACSDCGIECPLRKI